VRESAIAEIETDSKTKNCSEKKRRLQEQRDNVNGKAANGMAVGVSRTFLEKRCAKNATSPRNRVSMPQRHAFT